MPTKEEKADTDMRTGRKQEAYYCIGNEHRQTKIAVEEEDLDREPVTNKPGTRKPRTTNGNTFSSRGKRIWLGSRRWKRGCRVGSSIGANNGCSG